MRPLTIGKMWMEDVVEHCSSMSLFTAVVPLTKAPNPSLLPGQRVLYLTVCLLWVCVTSYCNYCSMKHCDKVKECSVTQCPDCKQTSESEMAE